MSNDNGGCNTCGDAKSPAPAERLGTGRTFSKFTDPVIVPYGQEPTNIPVSFRSDQVLRGLTQLNEGISLAPGTSLLRSTEPIFVASAPDPAVYDATQPSHDSQKLAEGTLSSDIVRSHVLGAKKLRPLRNGHSRLIMRRGVGLRVDLNSPSILQQAQLGNGGGGDQSDKVLLKCSEVVSTLGSHSRQPLRIHLLSSTSPQLLKAVARAYTLAQGRFIERDTENTPTELAEALARIAIRDIQEDAASMATSVESADRFQMAQIMDLAAQSSAHLICTVPCEKVVTLKGVLATLRDVGKIGASIAMEWLYDTTYEANGEVRTVKVPSYTFTVWLEVMVDLELRLQVACR